MGSNNSGELQRENEVFMTAAVRPARFEWTAVWRRGSPGDRN